MTGGEKCRHHAESESFLEGWFAAMPRSHLTDSVIIDRFCAQSGR
jgi:hypothetical protein